MFLTVGPQAVLELKEFWIALKEGPLVAIDKFSCPDPLGIEPQYQHAAGALGLEPLVFLAQPFGKPLPGFRHIWPRSGWNRSARRRGLSSLGQNCPMDIVSLRHISLRPSMAEGQGAVQVWAVAPTLTGLLGQSRHSHRSWPQAPARRPVGRLHISRSPPSGPLRKV